MNSQTTKTTKTGTTLVGLALACAFGAALGCSDSPGGSTPGTGGSGNGTAGTNGHGGTTGTAGTNGHGGTTGTAGTGTGGSTSGTAGTIGTAGTGGSGTGGSTAGTGGSGTGGSGTGGSTAGTGGSGTGGSTAGTGGSGTGGSTAGTGGSSTGGSGGGGAGGGGGSGPPPGLPPTLNAPAGASVKFHLHATGNQIYTCTASTAGAGGGGGAGGAGGSGATTYSYVLKQPDAKLYDPNNSATQVGTHGAGPNWTSTVDNSVVNGGKVWQENSPTSGAIPWLLLRATSHTGTGVFDDITYVQRVNTTGGVAPATGCDSTTAGTDTPIAYTADYYFYNGGGPGTAWNTPPGSLPTAIQVPSGATFKIHDHAIGVQVYTCTPAAGGAGGGGGAGGAGGAGATTYSWVLKQPDAVLYDSSFAQVGTHGLGPNWTSTVDNSVVNGAKVAGVNSTMTGAVQWLLLSATSNTGTGAFGDVTYIQRLNTAGGPATGTCDATTVNTDIRIPYSADYYFFTGGVAVDGGTGG